MDRSRGQQMPSALPGQVVVVVKGVVGEYLWVGVGPNVAGIVADTLPGSGHRQERCACRGRPGNRREYGHLRENGGKDQRLGSLHH